MDAMEAMRERHSVRSYQDKPLEQEVVTTLQNAIDDINTESGLHIQLIVNEPEAFDSFMAHYGKFSGVQNYLALVGPKGANLDETCGYYGEQLVLLAQQLGLNTCWVGLTFKKNKERISSRTRRKACDSNCAGLWDNARGGS